MKKILIASFAALSVFSCSAKKTATQVAAQDPWAKMAEVEKLIQAPTFRNQTYNIVDFGAKAGVEEYNNPAINNAIDECNRNGGGTVLVPAGIFYTGAITLKSNVNLHLAEGATLRFSTNPADYLPQVLTSWEGWECYNFRPLIYAYEQENIGITGKGTLDGQASEDNWWPWKGRAEYGWQKGTLSQEWNGTTANGGRNRLDSMETARVPVAQRIMTIEDRLRPSFVEPYRCKNVLIDGLTIIRSPFWLLHPMLSENVIVRNMTLNSHGPNNDGCDPESSKNVLIENCYFNTGDDCIAIKSGKNEDGRARGIPSENIIVRNCTMVDGHAGVGIGSEISGNCFNVWAENCKMDSPNLERVLRIKSNPIRGGHIENVFMRNITVGECAEAVFRVEMKYEKVTSGPNMPKVKNIQMTNITSQKSRYGVFIDGFDPATTGGKVQVSDVIIKDCSFYNVKTPYKILGAENVRFENLKINGETVKYK